MAITYTFNTNEYSITTTCPYLIVDTNANGSGTSFNVNYNNDDMIWTNRVNTTTIRCGDPGTQTIYDETGADLVLPTYDVNNPYIIIQELCPESAEQKQARIIQEKKKKQITIAAEKKKKEARKAAERLLLQVLDRQQRKEYRKLNAFYVTAPSGLRYRIECDKRHQNIFELDNQGNKVRELCIYTPKVPQGDNLASQKLLIENDEEKLRKIANIRELQRVA